MRLNPGGTLLFFAAGWMLIAAPLSAQTPVPQWQIAAGGKMTFDVASIRKSEPGTTPDANFPLDAGDAYAPVGGRFSARFPLSTYVKFAYRISLSPDQIQSMIAHLPAWVGTDTFDIQARAEGSPTKDQMRLMMQSLLAGRFRLAVHFETRQTSLFALTLIRPGKLGPKLRPHADGPSCDQAAAPPTQSSHAIDTDMFPPACDVYMLISKSNGARLLGSRNTTMDALAGSLSPFSSGRPVVDRTGLTGRFDFTIEWIPTPQGPAAPDAGVQPVPAGLTILEALNEQLGLKVESTQGPLQFLVIDHVERPSEN